MILLLTGLAMALCSSWLQRTGHTGIKYLNQMTSLTEEFVKGLASTSLQGRAQIVPDQFIESENSGNLVFYLDGAHSPESMDVCAKWFSHATAKDYNLTHNLNGNYSKGSQESWQNGSYRKQSTQVQILLFNCMSVRDPQMLLPHLMSTCASRGVHFNRAVFVPNTSVYYKVGTGKSHVVADAQVDVTWQMNLQNVWESIIHAEKGKYVKNGDVTGEAVISYPNEKGAHDVLENSSVFTSLPLAINWLRNSARSNQSVRFQVLVTGSLHLIGDVLRLIKK